MYQPGSLLIQDLGFFNLNNIQTVSDSLQSFFLTRWHNTTSLFLAQQPSQSLDMLVFLRQQRETVAEYTVLPGARHRLPCRMICVRLPEQVAAQRRRRAKADAKRRGETQSQYSISLTKARQVFQDRAKSLALAIGAGNQRLRDKILELCRRILRFARKTKRKERLSTLINSWLLKLCRFINSIP